MRLRNGMRQELCKRTTRESFVGVGDRIQRRLFKAGRWWPHESAHLKRLEKVDPETCGQMDPG